MSVIGTRAIERRAAVRDELRARFPALCPGSGPAPAPVDRSAIVLGRNQHGGAVKQKTNVLQGTLALMVPKNLAVLGPLHGASSRSVKICRP